MDVVPMVRGNTATAFHGTPRSPGGHLVAGRVPDTLTPNDILHFEGTSVLHDPLRNFFPRRSRNPSTVSDHQVVRLSVAVVRAARAVSDASNLPNAARELLHDLLGSINSNGLAPSHSWNLGCLVPPKSSGRRRAAFELAWTGASSGFLGSRTVGLPTAVSGGTVVAFGFGAAFDAGTVGGATTVGGDAAAGLAG